MDETLSFEQVLEELDATELGPEPSLLVGNGFSVACDASYSYRALKKNLAGRLPAISVELMERLETANVEQVMQILEDARWVGERLSGDTDPELAQVHTSTRHAMVRAIAVDHLRSPAQIDLLREGRSRSAVDFLSRFSTVFTTNYDLLLYWIVMKNNPKSEQGSYRFRDGFRREDPDDFGRFDPTVDVNLMYLHGALHLYIHGGETRKLVRGANRGLVKLINKVFDHGGEPLFVAAGRPEQKQEVIDDNPYLRYCFDKLRRIEGDLVVFGLSLGESDQHIFNALADNPRLRRVYLSLYGDPNSSGNLQMRSIGKRLEESAAHSRSQGEPALSVRLFDSSSARVWG